MLKALLLERFLRHDKILVAKAHLILRERKIITILRVIFYGLFIRVVLPAVVFLFGCSPDRVFIVFDVTRSSIFSGANVAV